MAGRHCCQHPAEPADRVIERRRIAGQVIALELLSGLAQGLLNIDRGLSERGLREGPLFGQPAFAQDRLQGAGHGLRVLDVQLLEQLRRRLPLGRARAIGTDLRSVPVQPGHDLKGRQVEAKIGAGRQRVDLPQHLVADDLA